MFEQISVSTGNQWMAVSLVFSICVLFSLKQRPALSYPVHTLFQSFHYHWPNTKCQGRWICRHFQTTRVIQVKKIPTTCEPCWYKQEANPNLITSTFHGFHPLILKHFYCFKSHREVALWLILMEISQESVFSADFQIQEMSWLMLKTPWYLAVFQPTSELWGQMATTMIFLQPQRAQTNMCKPSRLSNTSFEKMADATNPVCSTPSEPFLWHT